MVSFHDLLHSKLGGRRDAAAMLLVASGGFLTLPALLGEGYIGLFAAFGLAAAGGAVIGRRLAPKLRIDSFQYQDALEINSATAHPIDPAGAGMNIGYVGDRAEPLTIPLRLWMRHAFVCGQSGVGKTVLGSWLMFQQICRGGGLLWIDGKLEQENLQLLWLMASWCGRSDDVLVINPGDPSTSNSYNPLLDGDPDEIASRCVSLIPTSETNAGADYYRQNATIAVTTLVAAIQALGLRYSFADLRVLLSNAKALEWLQRELEAKGQVDAAVQLSLFLEQFRSHDKRTGIKVLDVDALKKTFGGLGSRLAQFGSGQFGQVMNSYSPEIRIKDAVMAGKIVYFMLPTMAKGEAATALARMGVADFRSAIAAVQALPKSQRPAKTFLAFFDEAGSYVTQAWARMFEQARSARLVMVLAFQTKANLEVLGEELRAMVVGNTNTKVYFKLDEPDTQKWAAETVGSEPQLQRSISSSNSTSTHAAAATDRVSKGAVSGFTSGGGTSMSESVRIDYKVTPDDFKRLGQGECIVQSDGGRLYKIHVPQLTFDDDFIARTGPFLVNHLASADKTEGLNLLARAQEFLE